MERLKLRTTPNDGYAPRHHMGGFVRYARRAINMLLACALATAAGVALAQPANADVHNTPGFVHIENWWGTCIDAQGPGAGARVVMWRCLNTEFEEWRLVQTPIPGNRYEHCACTTVTMFVNNAMDLCMAVENDVPANGAPVVVQNCNAADEKQWWTRDIYNGFIFSFTSKKALDVDDRRSNNGVPLQIWDYEPLHTQQKWHTW